MAEAVQKIVVSVSGGTDYTVPFLIGGDEVRTKETFDVVNPATGKVVHKYDTRPLSIKPHS